MIVRSVSFQVSGIRMISLGNVVDIVYLIPGAFEHIQTGFVSMLDQRRRDFQAERVDMIFRRLDK